MVVNHLLRSFIFLLTFKTGFSAEISVFVKTGDSVQLDTQTQELPEFRILYWRKDKSENIVMYIRGNDVETYKDRVDFNDKTFSLTLKNMQKNDSGLYRAIASGKSEQTIVTYRVSVIDAVEAPVLTVNSNWFSGNFCTVNFTCRAHDLLIHSSYQNNTCSPVEVTSREINTLTLDCSEESIICNHSNPVSWKKDRKNITQLCVNNKDKEVNTDVDKNQSSLKFWPYVLVAVCLLAFATFPFLYSKCKKDGQEADNTVYAQNEAQDQTQHETGDNRPNTIYCTVGQHQKPAVTNETDCTVYSSVCKQPTILSDDV